MRRLRRLITAVLGGAAVGAALLLVIGTVHHQSFADEQQTVPTSAQWTPSADRTSATAPSPGTSNKAVPSPADSQKSSDQRTKPAVSDHPASTCATGHGRFRPTSLVVQRLNVALPVLALPLEGGDTFPVPPFDGPDNPRWTAAWWKDGARPGTGAGMVHLDVHSYTDGSAAGNLFGHQLRPGDVIRLLDANGTTRACYRVRAVKTWAAAKIPWAALSRSDGSPGLAIEFCWDTPQNWGDRVWRERRYVIADQLT